MSTVASAIANGQDLLALLPVELRLLVFEHLLEAELPLCRGVNEFGPLHPRELDDQEAAIPWQIVLTCRRYYAEATNLIYKLNWLVFSTGARGTPGMFRFFPIHTHLMQHLRALAIFYRADASHKPSSQCVAHFLGALIRHATNLEHLVVVISSDRYHEAACPTHILFYDHPVLNALEKLVQARLVRSLNIRLQDGARLYNQWAHYLEQTFYENPISDGKNTSLVFALSCTCPTLPLHRQGHTCPFCGTMGIHQRHKPVWIHAAPQHVEADEQSTMELQADLMEQRLFSGVEDDDDRPEEDYVLFEDEELEQRLGLSAPWNVPKDAWRGGLARKAKYRQTTITSFFQPIQGHSMPHPGQLCFWRGREAPRKTYTQTTLDGYVVRI